MNLLKSPCVPVTGGGGPAGSAGRAGGLQGGEQPVLSVLRDVGGCLLRDVGGCLLQASGGEAADPEAGGRPEHLGQLGVLDCDAAPVDVLQQQLQVAR